VYPFNSPPARFAETLREVATDVARADRVPADDAERLDDLAAGDAVSVGELVRV